MRSATLGRGLRLGRIAGIEVRLDWSLAVIFALIVYGLAAGLFPAWHPDWPPATALLAALGAALLFLASLLAHELSHAIVGRFGGVRVRRITLFMLGGIAEMENEPPTWRAELVMAAVGPLTSLVLGFIFFWLAGIAAGSLDLESGDPDEVLAALSPLATLLLWLGPVNLLLAVFNLAPGFPLDGGRVLRAIVWGITGNLRTATRWASWGGRAFGALLIATGLLMLFGLVVPLLGGGPLTGLWLMFIGWFIDNAALVSYRQLLVKETLEAVPVGRLMQTQVARVDPDLPIARLAEEHMMASGQRVLPVERDGRLLGLVSLSDLQKSERRAWERMRAAEIMTPVARLACVSPQADAADALEMLAQHNVNQLPVVEHERLVGLLRREDVLKWLALRGADSGATAASL